MDEAAPMQNEWPEYILGEIPDLVEMMVKPETIGDSGHFCNKESDVVVVMFDGIVSVC